jgi:hypothetical protein
MLIGERVLIETIWQTILAMQTIEPEGVVCAITTEEQYFTDLADDTTDANDRDTPFSHVDLENLEVEYEC